MILVLGGTGESLAIMDRLLEAKYPAILSVATEYGKVFSSSYGDHLVQRRMDSRQMVDFINSHSIDLLLDASHPFAAQASRHAIQAAQASHISYFRFERPSTPLPESVTQCNSIEGLARQLKSQLTARDRVYLTTGSKSLDQWIQVLPVQQLTVRVLPTSQVLEHVESLGFQAQQVHAIKGPFNKELLRALFLQAGTTHMVSKESGSQGGLDMKLALAQELGIQAYVLTRPQLVYPIVYHDLETLMEAIHQRYS